MDTRIIVLTLFLAAPFTTMAAPPATVANGILTDADGMTLYTFDKDTVGSEKSACNDTCATNWPPFLAKMGEKSGGDYSLFSRDDGRLQWAFKGKPLYLWIKDVRPGDMKGDGVNNVWHVAKP